MLTRAPTTIEQQLAQLGKSFAANLPSRITEIDQAWQTATLDGWNPETVKKLHRLVHSLAGSATTFGQAQVGQSARQLELLLVPVIEQAAPPGPEPATMIAKRLNVLKESFSQSPTKSTVVEQRAPTLAVPEEESERLVFLVQGGAHLDQLAAQIGYFGYAVRISSGMDGLDKLLEHDSPMAVIVDAERLQIEMYSKRLAQIRGSDGKRVPIIFLSARNDLASRLSAVHTGADAYFVKPINVSQLIDKLDRLTSHSTPDPHRILIVEDDALLAQSYALTLEQAGMKTYTLSDPNLLLEQLKEWKPDLILMDVYMPEFSGLELASVIRQQADYVSIPIVFLSAETRIEKQLAALSLGGDDFLTKPIQPEHLISSVTARAQRSHSLRALIIRDGLTGLLNHTAIKGRLDIQLERAKRKSTPLAYAMLDIDYFKNVNDAFGHPTGDSVLKSLSRLLQQRLRKTDIIGRYGGEEFAIILPGATSESAGQVLDEIRVAFAQIPQQSGNKEFSATFSAGVAAWPQLSEAIRLNDAADKALYQAKQNGRNNVVSAPM